MITGLTLRLRSGPSPISLQAREPYSRIRQHPDSIPHFRWFKLPQGCDLGVESIVAHLARMPMGSTRLKARRPPPVGQRRRSVPLCTLHD